MICVYFTLELNFVIRTAVKVYILRGVQQMYDVANISISHRCWKKIVIHLIITFLFNYAPKYVECN